VAQDVQAFSGGGGSQPAFEALGVLDAVDVSASRSQVVWIASRVSASWSASVLELGTLDIPKSDIAAEGIECHGIIPGMLAR
jgi:hypothetical protein